MDREGHHQRIIKSLKEAEGPVVFGEGLLEVNDIKRKLGLHPNLGTDISEITVDALKGEFREGNKEIDRILKSSRSATEMLVRIFAEEGRRNGETGLAGDVVNLLHYVEILQRIQGTRRRFRCVLAGPIGTEDELGKFVMRKMPAPVANFAKVSNRYSGVYGILAGEGTQGNIPLYDRKESAARDFLRDGHVRQSIADLAGKYGIFYTSLIALGTTREFGDFLDLIRRVKEAEALTILDTNYRKLVMENCFPEKNKLSPREAFEEVLSMIDVLLGGREDLRMLYPNEPRKPQNPQEEMRELLERIESPKRMCLVKAAEDGVYWIGSDGRMRKQNIPRTVTPRDTTGAGDAFNAGLIIALREGKNLESAVKFAQEIASCVIQRHGANLGPEVLKHMLRKIRGASR